MFRRAYTGLSKKRGSTVSRRYRKSRNRYGPEKSGYRRSKLASERKSHQRRNLKLIIYAGLLLSIAAFITVFVMQRSEDSGKTGFPEPEQGEGSGNIIAVGRDEAGKLNQLLLIVPGEREGYAVYTIPAQTLADSPGHGFQRLDRVYELGGQPLLDQTVADLLQIPIQYHIVFSNAAIEIAVDQAGTINFKTDRPLALTTENGVVALAPGDNVAGVQLSISYLKGSLADRQSGPRVQALFYRGLREALSTRPDTDRRSFASQLVRRLETDLDNDEFVDLYVALTAPGGDFEVSPLPVRAMVNGQDWYYEPVIDQIDALLAGSPGDSSYDLEIQNGTDAVGVVEAAGNRLASPQYNLTLKTDPSGVDYDFTQIRTGTEAVLEGNHIRDLLGKGTIIKDEYLEKRQIIVIIGKDLNVAELEKR